MKLTVVLPAFNEQDSIVEVIHKVQQTLLAEGAEYEIIVVDDASTDETGRLAAEAGARVIRNPENLGYGASLRRGIAVAQHEYIVIADADGTYPVARIPELVKPLDEGYDMVVGARYGRYYENSLVKTISRWLFKRLSEFVVGRRIPDINSGFRGFRKTALLPALPYTSAGFSFTTTITLIFFAQGLFVKYVPVEYFQRQGKSKVNYFRDSLRALQAICEVILRFNPLKMFLLLSFFPLGMMLVCLVVAAAADSGQALILAALSFLVATLIWGLGLLGFTIQRAS